MCHCDSRTMDDIRGFSPCESSVDSRSSNSEQSPASVLSPQIHSNNFLSANNMFNEKPQLKIVVQPIERFRFRYRSEMMGTHGTLMGNINGTGRRKNAPSVEIRNYSGEKAIVRCRLVTVSPDRRLPHAHRLVRRDGNTEQDDPHEIVVTAQNGYLAVFQGMGIIHTARKYIKEELLRKLKFDAVEKLRQKNMNITQLGVREETQVRMQAESAQKHMNLNSVALCFQGFVENQKGYLMPLTEPVYSHPINNLKSALTGELKICRVDRTSGCCEGSDEVFILVEKVGKKNIKIKFFEQNEDDQEIWSAYARFSELDVHHQYAIVFRTPPYKDLEITEPKDVFIQLERPTDGDCSLPIKFTYKPSDKLGRKRIRMSYSGSSELARCRNTSIRNLSSERSYGISTAESRSSSINLEQLLQLDQCASDDFKKFLSSLDEDKFMTTFDERDNMLAIDGKSEQDDNFALNVVSDAAKIMRSEPSKLKEKIPSLLTQRTKYGDSPLHWALRMEQYYVVQYILLILGSDPDYKHIVNIQNSSGKTPLHYAVLQNQPQITNTLLELGADANICDDRGSSALHSAVKLPNAGKCVKALLPGIVKIDAPDDIGWTPLQLAAEAGSAEAVKYLVEAGADVNCTDTSCGRTALHIAVEGGHLNIVEYLLKETNINVNKRNFSGNTALHSAVVNTGQRAEELCKLLLQYKADPHIPNNNRLSTKEEDDDDEIGIKREVTSDDEEGQTSYDLASNKPAILRLFSPTAVRDNMGSSEIEIKQEVTEQNSDVNCLLDSANVIALASILDKTGGWKKIIKHLKYDFLLKELNPKIASPSLVLLNYLVPNELSAEQLEDVLTQTHEDEAADMLSEMLSILRQ
ncbi:nuclear factor NF-kappa-B p100 subunit isoform X2 [Orussus abietinus]|uniref:nuclear factor NF-kappa-B p100 subunit isoform X2 n=1 Tax=Orussus abietinus TaxID=222816 RepID=UPI0006265113|nr:nuclear factor NF-kappa-B p100 subunit isoform X2 [Orussus abietinus]